MTTHFRPANTSVQEMKPWELEAKPEKLKLSTLLRRLFMLPQLSSAESS